MGESAINSIENNSISVSRNSPVALVVGSAGFLGSFLVEKLLSKNIQVIGVDNFKTGSKDYMEEASKNKDFHLLITDASELAIELQRLDYLFIATSEKIELRKVLLLAAKKKSRVVFISSVDLYGAEVNPHLRELKEKEREIAKFAEDFKINARIIRLGAVFGPRMNFKSNDPLFKLIKAAVKDQLQKNIPLDFSTRALYIDDAIELILKAIFAGATAQKIFDGVLTSPIEIAEVKQILLDPVWYENKGFKPNELPPWNTPNLEKTEKFLNWKPKAELVSSLKNTLMYFKENNIEVPEIEEEISDPVNALTDEKKRQLESFKTGNEGADIKESKNKKSFKKISGAFPRISGSFLRINIKSPLMGLLRLSLLAVFVYVVVWPIIDLSYGVFTFQYNLNEATKSLEKGDLEKSFSSIDSSKRGLNEVENVLKSVQSLKEISFFKNFLVKGDDLVSLFDTAITAIESSAKGVEDLYQGFKAVTGESSKESKIFFDSSLTQLSLAGESLARIDIKLSDESFINGYPVFLKNRILSLKEKLNSYKKLVDSARATAILLPSLTGGGSKSYLVLLQNNGELRPTGGFIGSVAKITFENGKLKKVDTNDVYALDGQLSIHVEPPKELKDGLNQKDWFLRDSNWEPDFPTAARQAEWFFGKETGENVNGVIAIDITSIQDLLSVIGALDITDYDKKITDANLFQEAITHAEVGFFPGSQAKKSFLTALENQLFNKLFFVPNQNWPGIVRSLGRSLEQKHISIYLNDPKLFSYVVSQNWQASLPRVADPIEGQTSDLLVPVEANVGANKANFYIDRKYNLETVIGKEGDIRHRLKITYTNRSPADTFPAGSYKNRMRIYLPFGTRLFRVLWGDTDITKSVTTFADYGRSAISFLIELPAKESKDLVVDYTFPGSLGFKDGKALYKLDVIKQAGTLKDPFVWKLSYPINFKITSKEGSKDAPQSLNIETDLSTDKSLEVEFSK